MLTGREVLKENESFFFATDAGTVPRDNSIGYGLYRLDTRFLSAYEVSAEAPGVIVKRSRVMSRGLHERIEVQNQSGRPADARIRFVLDADFLDVFEVRSRHRSRDEREVRAIDGGVRFQRQGGDGVLRATEVLFSRPFTVEGGAVLVSIPLDAGAVGTVDVCVYPLIDGQGRPEGYEGALQRDGFNRRLWTNSCTRFETDAPAFNSLLERSIDDIRLLCDEVPGGALPTAGVPWYACPFGRDSIITSLQCLTLNPRLAVGTLRFLAAHQGTTNDEFREEEPGKILHELRRGELAGMHQIPHTPYFGSVDATPLFLILACEAVLWTGDVELFAELEPNIQAAVEWLDASGDGFIEYAPRSSQALRNQGWKDSGDSLTHVDGSTAPLPAALVEVQGYAYRARSLLARIYRRLAREAEAFRLEQEAEELKRRFEQAFWSDSIGFYGQALDRDRRLVAVITSNPGHCLWSGIVDPVRAGSVVERLVAPDMFSGWGIRTLSSRSLNFNPLSYHNGSVWPHDTSLCMAGMRRYGHKTEAELVAHGIVGAGLAMSDQRLPELFSGAGRVEGRPPDEYPVSCSPQAWAAAVPFLTLQTLAGIEVDATNGVIRIDPIPTRLYGRLRIEGMWAGTGEIDLTIESEGSRQRVRVDRNNTDLVVESPG